MISAMEITDLQKRAVFKALATKSQFLVGKDFDFNKYYESKSGIINQVNKIYQEVKEAPEKFAISQEVLDMVEKAMQARKSTHTDPHLIKVDPGKVNERDLVVGAKQKVWVLLNQKLDYLAKNKQAFRNESIMSIAKVAGIVFDKAQITNGEATEHISLKAKINENITPGEALEALLKTREGMLAEGD